MKPTTKPHSGPTRPVNIRLTPGELSRLRKHAERDNRTVANLIALLVRTGLTALDERTATPTA